MFKIKGSNDIITFQNEQCSCFGSTNNSQHQFLAKQKPFSPPPLPDNNLPSYKEQSFAKNQFKKSLKRPLVPLRSPNDDLLQSKSPNPLEKSRELRQFMSPQSKVTMASYKTFMVPSEPVGAFYTVTVPPREIISCKTIQQTPPPLAYLPPQAALTAFHSPNKTIKINYNTPSPSPASPASYASPQKRTFSPISASTCPPKDGNCPATFPVKQERLLLSPNTQHPQEKQEGDRSESTKIISKVKTGEPVAQKEETSKSCIKLATMRSGIGIGKQKGEPVRAETGKSMVGSLKSKHEGKRQGETGRSRIDVKSLKEERRALKKMDDVEEIYSQADSEELSDSDKESVVLGRLNEYGSMIEPALSNISQQSEAKIMRFNSLSIDLDQEINRVNSFDNFLTY